MVFRINSAEKIGLVLVTAIILLVRTWVNGDLGIEDRLKAEQLPECQACEAFVTSFQKGIERTARYKFEGGDATWEERNQGKYAQSEVRLTEIQEGICKEVKRGQLQCHKLASEYEEHLERWWFEEQKVHTNLSTWLCIDTVKVCCSQNTYGPECQPCPGGVEKPCGGHGRCRGSGTRKGTGGCRCDRGYGGEGCDKCNTGFYQDLTNESVLMCYECHKACKGHCRDGTSKGCEVCWDGWINHPELGCLDVDECLTEESLCEDHQFCVNTEGSYRCIDCHRSCASCQGDAPDECLECKKGYTRNDKFCIDSNEWWRTMHSRWGRYFTYFGLCLATFIIFKKSVFVAGLIGLAVATYIGVSEYISTDSSPVATSRIFSVS